MNMTERYNRAPRNRSQDVDWVGLVQVTCVVVFIFGICQVYKISVQRQEDWKEVTRWLKRNDLAYYEQIVYSSGIRSMHDVANFKFSSDKTNDLNSVPQVIVDRIEKAIQLYQDELILNQWLQDHSLEKYSDRLASENIHSLEKLAFISERTMERILGSKASTKDQKMFRKALDALRILAPNFNQYTSSQMAGWIVGSIIGGLLFIAFLVIFYAYGTVSTFFALLAVGERFSLLNYVTGHYLSSSSTTVEWMWEDGEVVGQTFQFIVKFFNRNGQPYLLSGEDRVKVEITKNSVYIQPTVRKLEQDGNGVRVKFTVLKSGTYKIAVFYAGKHICGSPFLKKFISGPLDPEKSLFVHQGSIVVGCKGKKLTFMLEPRDSYDNLIDYTSNKDISNKFHILLTETNTHSAFEPEFQCNSRMNVLNLTMTVEVPGCYHTVITCYMQRLKNSEFHTIILTESELAGIEKAIAKKCQTVSFEARLLSTNFVSPMDRGKKIQCYISPKQFTIKEFHLRIIPKKLYAFRVCPSTKFQFLGVHNQLEMPVLSIDDGSEKPVLLASKDRDVIAATFSKLLMKNIGGSETFTDKRDFFYHEIRQLHSKRIHYRLPIRINRNKLLESSVKATKHFSTSDWCKNFEITFDNEEGLDWGGLKREWFELLSREMFDPTKSGMFIRFNDDPQALAHPNHQLPPGFKLKYYEFAGKIVGKCLYESALGGSYKLQVRAMFTRSFLAQLIGLRINYKYFETDDPVLYTQKIRYIEQNDVDDLEMTFSEEEFNGGKLVKVVDLVPNGSRTLVTNSNKMKYLDLLAQYKLSTRVRDQIDAFLKGLNELIPDNLLSIFDEDELELLMCGTGQYSIEDFKKHHTVCGNSPLFQQTVEWFWDIVSSYSQEEMARLLQFTTGCSQLPPGGFAELVPPFQLCYTTTYNVLPSAHTCFNQLCLPTYDSFERMEYYLHVAITEGSMGFSLT